MKAPQSEEVTLTTGRKRTATATVDASKQVKERALDLFPHPDFQLPDDFDELPEHLAALLR